MRQGYTSPAKQAVRIRRFALGLSAYGISILLLGIAHVLDLIALGPVIAAVASMAAINAAVYAALRTRLET